MRENKELPSLLIFSVNSILTHKFELDWVRVVLKKIFHEDVQTKQIEGKWEGETEYSYVIDGQYYFTPMFPVLLAKLRETKQKEVLYLQQPESNTSIRRKAWTIHTDTGLFVYSGWFVPTTQSNAFKQNGYSFDVATGEHYIIQGE